MHVAIIGFGIEGKSSCDYFLAQGHTVTICDANADLPTESRQNVSYNLGPKYLDCLNTYDLIVRTAGINPQIIIDKYPDILDDKITSNINEFLANCPTKNIIGVTGTKGKGTTSTLITKMLERAGKTVFLGGNIGIPALSLLPEITPDDWVVLELSSFQLEDIKYAPHIGVCLMVAPEHLNWHNDLVSYHHAKANLFLHQTSSDIAIYYADNEISHTIASSSPGDKIAYGTPPGAYVENDAIYIDGQLICNVDEVKLLGAHNLQNICAAVTAVWQAGVMDIVPIRDVATTFSGLEHRLEFVATSNEVSYYDDSFGTTPETAIVALRAFKQPKVIILGGSDKGASYDDLAKTVTTSDVRHVVAIGDTAPPIIAALERAGFKGAVTKGLATMPEIVSACQRAAQPGYIVLLSTGCASFGLFSDYKDRGNQFKKAVQSLAVAAQ